jgi:metal-dependent hydrolase (beta-lactamase superfamily II)
MTALTGYADMLALQGKSGQIMIEGCREPGIG